MSDLDDKHSVSPNPSLQNPQANAGGSLSRRSFIGALLAAPFIVNVDLPATAHVVSKSQFYYDLGMAHYIGSQYMQYGFSESFYQNPAKAAADLVEVLNLATKPHSLSGDKWVARKEEPFIRYRHRVE